MNTAEFIENCKSYSHYQNIKPRPVEFSIHSVRNEKCRFISRLSESIFLCRRRRRRRQQRRRRRRHRRYQIYRIIGFSATN